MAQRFLLTDPQDNYVGPALESQAWQANRLYIVGAIIVVSGNAWQAITVTGPTGWTIPAFPGSLYRRMGAPPGARSGRPVRPSRIRTRSCSSSVTAPTGIHRSSGTSVGSSLRMSPTSTRIRRFGGSTFAVYVNGLEVQSSGYLILGRGLKLSSTMFYGLYVRFNTWAPFTNFVIGDLSIDPAGHLQQATTNGETGPLGVGIKKEQCSTDNKRFRYISSTGIIAAVTEAI